MISYAQNREDVLLDRVFRGQPSGFYVDVGAYHPVNDSVTKHFYDLGWSGINVEPGRVFEALQAERPRDVNLNVAVSDRSGVVTFYEHPQDPGTSTLAAELADTLAHCREGRLARTVRAVTLRELFDAYKPPVIDFLKIDAEGHEREVLLGNDWAQYRPRVLILEATLPWSNVTCHDRWEDLVLGAGYRFAHFDGLNRYYVRDEDESLLPRFAYPVCVLDLHVRADRVWYEQEMNRYRTLYEAAWSEGQQFRAGLEDSQRQRDALRHEAERLHQEVRRVDGLARACEADRSRLRGDLDRAYQDLQRLEAAAARQREDAEGKRRRLARALRAARAGGHQVTEQARELAEKLRHCAAARAGLEAHVARAGKEREALAADCIALAAACTTLRAEREQLTRHTGPTSLPVGLGVARLLHRLRPPFSRRPPLPVPRTPPDAVAAPATGPRRPSAMNLLKRLAKAVLRPGYLLALWAGRPLAWKIRGFLLQPVRPQLEGIHADLKAQAEAIALKHADALARHVTHMLALELAPLREQQAALQAQLHQLTATVNQVRDQQQGVLAQVKEQEAVLRETDRLVLALLKSAQLRRPDEADEDRPRLYRAV